MIPEKMLEVLKNEGVVAIVTQGQEVHVVNTWNSYIKITEEGTLLIPAGSMNKTEENIKKKDKVLVTIGSREVEGFHSMGTGFLIKGTGEFSYEGEDYDIMKESFPWMRAVLRIKPSEIKQTL
ncbi:MAG: FMN-binding protein [Tissierella sp.]|nr:FMN-binding protein [Tissierella sp.]